MLINKQRYQKMQYRRLGTSGLHLPILSLGLWNNFGADNHNSHCEEILWHAFNAGITHFDLANNYGPPAGSAETNFGKILATGLGNYRDELIISTKAGYGMWPGPYGEWGSRKYLIASLNQSLKRMNLDYVDIFYHHRPDPNTNIRETMIALRDIVLSGKALYVGVSNYTSAQLQQAIPILQQYDVPYVITQPKYSMNNRWIEEDGLLTTQTNFGGGTICFSPIDQGRLSEKYIDGIPEDSRACDKIIQSMNESQISDGLRNRLRKLKVIAQNRAQTVTQLALVWALRDLRMTSALIGVRTVAQLEQNLAILDNLTLSVNEIAQIEQILIEPI